MLDAGVVDQDIHGAELAENELEHLFDVLGLGHVRTGIGHGNAEFLGDRVLLRVDFVGIAKAVEDNGGSGGGQRAGDAKTDAAGRTGDKGDLVFQALGGGCALLASYEIYRPCVVRCPVRARGWAGAR
jgi:hypothetical protein